ncbi:MAG: AraC family transcriptional regulator [Candidatus Didemnitutus sp.]|nr:AraC family transcriptional regulator [Candidatus Didemnitutus sp.]
MPTNVPVRPPEFISQQVSAARRFYLNLNPRRTRGMTIVCGGWEECAADYRIERADFPFLSLELVAAGRGEVRLAGARHEIGPGSVFVYGPGVPHEIRTSADAPLGKYFVNFVGDQARALLRARQLSPGGVVMLGSPADVRVAFDALIRLGGRLDAHTARAAALQLELLIIAIGRAAQPATPAERLARATFERCRAHLDTNFLRCRTIEDAAAVCHVNASYLSRLFRRFQGDTPYRYLQRRQMQWAAERLHASDRLVQEVADELGIDPFQFSRVFKRVHGVSPSAFLSAR